MIMWLSVRMTMTSPTAVARLGDGIYVFTFPWFRAAASLCLCVYVSPCLCVTVPICPCVWASLCLCVSVPRFL